MLHIKRQFLLFAVFATVVAPGLAVAAHSPTSDPLATEVVRVSEQETIERPIVVATTNIYNAQIVIQEGQEVTVLFELYNAEGVQSGVVYGIELYANDGSGRQLADSAVYNSKPVTLGSGETLPVAVTYVAPAFMSGAYEVWIMAKTQSGMPLALALAGEVTFVGKGGQIKVSDCIAEVDGTEYALTAGVDLARTESLSVTCLAENMFNEPTEVTPQFMNYERSVYGPVSETGVPITQSKLLPPNVKTKMTFLVPLASKPQAYDAVMKLVDRTTGAVVSSPVVIHYVIQGASATIHNVVFDKETYHTGDNAKAVVSWSLAADSFVNARGAGTAVGPLTLSVVMADAAGAFCSAPSVLSLQGASILSQLTIPVLRDCPSPQLVLSLADESGTAMTKQSFEYEPVVASEELKEPVTVASQFAMVASLVLLIVVLLVVAVKLLGFVRARVPAPTQLYEPINTTKKTEATISTLLGIVGFSLLFFGGFTPTTLAATLTVTSGFDTVTFAVNLNKATYLVNEQVQVSGAAFVTGCGNAITAGGLEATDGQGVVQSIGIFNMDPYSNPGGFAMFDKNIAGYSSPGVKLMPIRAYVTVSNVLNSAFGNLPLTVVCPDGSTGDGSQCVSNSPVPIGTIAGSGCTISAGDNTCVGTISWNAEHTTAPTVRNVTTNTIYSYNANGVNEQRTISHGVNVIAIYDQANLLDNQAIIGACEGGSSWNGSLCEAAAQPTATISATSCTIDEGDSSCATALTWHIQSATTPNVKDGTIGVVLSTDTSGTAVPFTITHGSHEMQVRDGVAVLDSAQATASCQTGTNWDGTKCVSSVIGGSITVSLTANGDDIGTNIIVGEDIQLGWVVTGTPDHCVASDDWSGSKATAGGSEWVMNVSADSTFTLVCTGTNGSASDTVVVTARTRPNLVPIGLSLSPSAVFDPVTGIYNSLFVQYSIQNSGGMTADSFVDRLKLDRDNDGSYEDSLDVAVVTGLAAGADTPLSPRLLAVNVPFGTHRVWLKTDVHDTVTESNENDNQTSFLLSVPVPDPQLELIASPRLVRSGGSINLSWDTKVTFPMDCKVRGPRITKDFDPSTDGPTDSQIVTGLTAKSEFVLQCTEPTTGTVFTDTAWIEVLPTIQEI